MNFVGVSARAPGRLHGKMRANVLIITKEDTGLICRAMDTED
jgi:hypothetical protein